MKKQRAGASFKAIKLKLGFGFDEDFWFRWSIRQAVSETMRLEPVARLGRFDFKRRDGH